MTQYLISFRKRSLVGWPSAHEAVRNGTILIAGRKALETSGLIARIRRRTAKMAARNATGDLQLALLVRERQDLVDEWQKRDAARSAAVAQSPSKRNKQKEAKSVARLSAIDNRIAEIDKRLAVDFPDYAALASPVPLKIADAQKQLKTNEALVLFLDTPTAARLYLAQ
jgi:hypothetical protein